MAMCKFALPRLTTQNFVNVFFKIFGCRPRLGQVGPSQGFDAPASEVEQNVPRLIAAQLPYAVTQQQEEHGSVGQRFGVSRVALPPVVQVEAVKVDVGSIVDMLIYDEPVLVASRLRPDGTMRGGPTGLVVHENPHLFGGQRFITDSTFRVALAEGHSSADILSGRAGVPEMVVMPVRGVAHG